MTISGIYKIQNISSGRLYIGSSQDVTLRLRKHREHLRRGDHVNKPLQNAFNKYGEDSFIFEKILICEIKDLIFYEQKIIEVYKANIKPFGYNTRTAAENNRGMVFDRGTFKKGDKYGRLTLIRRYENKANHIKWLCGCACGNTTVANINAVKRGGISSCGCLLSDVLQAKQKHKSGDTYNRFTLVSLHEKIRVGDCLRSMWLMRCVCGTEKILNVNLVTRGATKSCGCLVADMAREKSKTHGKSKIKTYNSWISMRRKCYSPDFVLYKNFGAKGIGVCESWRDDFAQFLSDIGEAPEGYSLTRKDNLKDFSPDNCYWGYKTETSNSSRNRYILLSGKKYLLRDAEKFLGIYRSSINQRSRGFGCTYQQAADHFYKKYLLKLFKENAKEMCEKKAA